jgi:hypothetical protein
VRSLQLGRLLFELECLLLINLIHSILLQLDPELQLAPGAHPLHCQCLEQHLACCGRGNRESDHCVMSLLVGEFEIC